MATPSERSILHGASATKGYLSSLQGYAAGAFGALAGNPVVDTLFIAGMLLPGLALVLGAGTRIALVSAAVMFLMLWITQLPLENNPFLDQHLFYVLAAALLLALDAGRYLGFGPFWRGLPVVRDQRWLW
jgi:thiosulfate dehydrogenase [quinone] large subunit